MAESPNMQKQAGDSTDNNSDDRQAVYEEEYQKSVFRELAEVLIFGLTILLFFKTFVWQNFQIPTASMENSLLIGDHITANTFVFKNSSPLEKKLFPFRDVRRGDVVVFKFVGDDKQDWIKRCIGLPGDRFKMINDQIFINERPLEETYSFYKHHGRTGRDKENRYYPVDYHTLKPGIANGQSLKGENLTLRQVKNLTRQYMRPLNRKDPKLFRQVMARLQEAPADEIPEGFYLMIGDNRNHSFDGRRWGLLPRELIHGRAYFVWWSYGEDEGSHEKKGFDFLYTYLRVPITFWTRTHWPETFSRIK